MSFEKTKQNSEVPSTSTAPTVPLVSARGRQRSIFVLTFIDSLYYLKALCTLTLCFSLPPLEWMMPFRSLFFKILFENLTNWGTLPPASSITPPQHFSQHSGLKGLLNQMLLSLWLYMSDVWLWHLLHSPGFPSAQTSLTLVILLTFPLAPHASQSSMIQLTNTERWRWPQIPQMFHHRRTVSAAIYLNSASVKKAVGSFAFTVIFCTRKHPVKLCVMPVIPVFASIPRVRQL